MSRTSEASAPPAVRSVWDTIRSAHDPQTRHALAVMAVTAVEVDGSSRHIPPFMLDLPQMSSGPDALNDLLARIVLADRVEDATARTETVKASLLVGKAITVLSVTVGRSDLEDSTWGAYILMRCADDDGAMFAVATGSAQVCVTMWRLHHEGRLPARGSFVEVAEARKGQSAPLGFRVENEL